MQSLATLKAQLPLQLAAAKVKDDERRTVIDLLQTLEAILVRPIHTPDEQVAQAREYLARGGELRDLLDDLRLADPGDLLPPGPRSRLGILFRPNAPDGRPYVTQVLPQYRGDKMGMQVGDIVVTLNGAPVSAADLVQQVVKATRPYRIEVLRSGRKVLLEEPKTR